MFCVEKMQCVIKQDLGNMNASVAKVTEEMAWSVQVTNCFNLIVVIYLYKLQGPVVQKPISLIG
jgi:hypothetical protein